MTDDNGNLPDPMTEDAWEKVCFMENKPPPRIASMTEARPKSEVEKAGDHIRKDFVAICENATTVAQLRRAMYLAYIKEGFSAEEALVLCCK